MNKEKITFCRICEPTCPMIAEINDEGKVVKLKPDPGHVLGGIPCNKGITFLDHHNDPDRLNWPLMRQNARSESQAHFVRVGWDQAISEVAHKLLELQKKYGKNAVAIYIGNPIGFDARALNVAYTLPAALGSQSFFSAGTQDCTNKFVTALAMYGSSKILLIPDLKHTDYLLCIGANPKLSHWTFVGVPNDGGQILKDIKQRGGTVQFVNPRKVESSTVQTGETLQIKPDTDVYFLAALSCEIYQQGGFDEAQLAKYGKNVQSYKDFICSWPAAKVVAITGITAGEIKRVAADIINAKSAACYISTGVNQGRQGSLTCWLSEMLNFASGNLGKEGGTYKASGLMDPEADPKFSLWDSPDGSLPVVAGGLPCVLLPDLIERGEVRALICISGNPLLSMAGEDRLRKAFKQLDLMVCVDVSPTVTTQLADYILPAADWLEREDITAFSLSNATQLIPSVQYTEATETPAGERRSDWWIMSRLLQQMGLPSQMDDPNHRDGFQMIDMMLSGVGLSIEQLKQLPHHTALIPELPKESVFDRCLLHEDKKIDCCPEFFVEGGLFDRLENIYKQLQAEPADTLKMISMRTAHMHNSWMANVDTLRRGNQSDNRLRMCPEDAIKRGLFDGDLIRVFNNNGKIKCRVEIRDDLRPGVVAMSHGYGHAGARGLKVASNKPGSNCNKLLPTGSKTYEPLSFMSWMSGVPVKIEKTQEIA